MQSHCGFNLHVPDDFEQLFMGLFLLGSILKLFCFITDETTREGKKEIPPNSLTTAPN